MKLKLSVKTPSTEAAPPEPSSAPAVNEAPATVETPSTAGPKLNIKLKNLSAAPTSGSATEAPKEKRKYVRKPKFDENGQQIPPGKPGRKPGNKRSNENGEEGSPAAKRTRKPSAKLVAATRDSDDEDDARTIAVLPRAAARPTPLARAPSIKISIKQKGQDGPQALQRAPTFIKLKGQRGKPPVRPPGVGYDSEAEEAEDDPAIESQFVLRMKPGPDCDALRKAIDEKKVGVAASNGGVPVNMRFFDREGRRAIVSVFGRHYAAAMVDLPCVIESMKSWNKKDWVKTADVCQMLLVLGQVKDEEEAKNYQLPREVNRDTMQYAHGLTPPMHWVRKRRFRPRVSYRRIEEVEEQVEALLSLDRQAQAQGGKTEYQVIDADAADTSESEEESEDEEMEEAPEYAGGRETPTIEIDAGDMDNDELEAALAAGLMADDEEVDVDGLFGNGEDAIDVETSATAHDVATAILGQDSALPSTETPASISASTPATQSADDDDDDADESDEDGGPAVDEEKNLEMENLQDEIKELESDLASHQEKLLQYQANVMFANRQKAIIQRVQEDIDIKKGRLAQLQGGEQDD